MTYDTGRRASELDTSRLPEVSGEIDDTPKDQILKLLSDPNTTDDELEKLGYYKENGVSYADLLARRAGKVRGQALATIKKNSGDQRDEGIAEIDKMRENYQNAANFFISVCEGVSSDDPNLGPHEFVTKTLEVSGTRPLYGQYKCNSEGQLLDVRLYPPRYTLVKFNSENSLPRLHLNAGGDRAAFQNLAERFKQAGIRIQTSETKF